MKIALFYNPSASKPYVGDEFTDKYCTDLARMSEWVEVEFPPLSAEGRQEQLARLEAAKDAARKYCDEQLARINQKAEALQA